MILGLGLLVSSQHSNFDNQITAREDEDHLVPELDESRDASPFNIIRPNAAYLVA